LPIFAQVMAKSCKGVGKAMAANAGTAQLVGTAVLQMPPVGGDAGNAGMPGEATPVDAGKASPGQAMAGDAGWDGDTGPWSFPLEAMPGEAVGEAAAGDASPGPPLAGEAKPGEAGEAGGAAAGDSGPEQPLAREVKPSSPVDAGVTSAGATTMDAGEPALPDEPTPKDLNESIGL
jgi:hypothetical protein